MERLSSIPIVKTPLVKLSDHVSAKIITLSNSSNLNALNRQMISFLTQIVSNLKKQTVIFKGEGRAFCSGGDVKQVYRLIQNDKVQQAINFFLKQFQLDLMISKLQGLTIAVWDGIVMGGGVGLTFMCKKIIATPKSLFAMPQCKIGFLTDVGTSYLFSKLGKAGIFLAVTGYRLKGKQIYDWEIATDYTQSLQSFDILKERSTPQRQLSTVNMLRNMKFQSFQEFLSQINELPQGLSKQANSHIKQNCLFSMIFVFHYVRKAISKKLSYQECIQRDRKAIEVFVTQSGLFRQGVRASLIQKGSKANFKSDMQQASIKQLAESF